MNKPRHGGMVYPPHTAKGPLPEHTAANPAAKVECRGADAAAAQAVDFSANINPLGFPGWLHQVIHSQIDACAFYPDPDCHAVRRAMARRYGMDADGIVAANGSAELMSVLPRAMCATRAVIPVPAYLDYEYWAQVHGMTLEYVPLHMQNGFALCGDELATHLHGDELVYLGHPGNPHGQVLDYDAVYELAARHGDSLFVIDEAFGDFVEGFRSFRTCGLDNVIVLYSLTKMYAIPGIRIGFAFASPGRAERIQRLLPCWSVNTFAQAVGCEVCADTSFEEKSRRYVDTQRQWLYTNCSRIPGLQVYPGSANFLLMRIGDSGGENACSPETLYDALQRQGVVVRRCDNFTGLDHTFFRVAVKTAQENARLYHALAGAVEKGFSEKGCAPRAQTNAGRTHRAPKGNKRGTPACMCVGTSSHAGKSILTAALCRIMVQDGFDVACFKAQNMSLNSYVTADGKEMGRAQVVQAEACRLEPDVRMNPVLLKPHQDDGSEIIVMGEPIGRMNARTYHTYRDTLQRTVHRAYDDLAAEHEVMVLEGAGSVGEINLKHTDIVNMPMAAHAGAHTFLVGDIDRGGVFASCIGILNTMEQWERRLIKGYLINKFRGDPSLLDTAYAYLERYTGVPVLGTVAFIDDMVIAGEDSVDMDMRSTAGGDMTRDRITIGMIVLPHISNYTDMDALRLEPDVRVEPVRRPEQIEGLDVVVIPGSKNVCADMRMLHARGFAAALRKAGHNPAQELVGICGGFQMLGHEIVEGDDADPAVLNDARNVPRIRGIGCIDMRSLYRSRKTRRRVHATFIEADQPVCGYEIHYGYTRAEGLLPVLRSADTDMDPGARSPDGSCWGCYLHGVFDADGFRRWFINRVRMRKGMPPLAIQTRYNQDAQLDMVAKRVREAVQLDRIYAMLGIA